MLIQIEDSRDALLTEAALVTLKDRYMLPEEKSPQQAFARAAAAFADDEAHAQRIYDYVSKQWAMFASPVLANGGTNRGQCISCFLSYVEDSLDGLVTSYAENVYLTTGGGGIGNYFGHLRSDGTATSRGTKSTGVIGFIKTVETQMLAYSQGTNRRGAAAIYMDISHPEIEEFITMRKPGGDPNRKALARSVFHNAVNIPDLFMQAVEAGGSWPLVDPHTKHVTKVVDARELWTKLLETRMETGEPYFHFIDASNRALHPKLKEANLLINQSNLCSEILLPTNKDRTAVCCLSSVNLEKWDEWKEDPLFIEDWIRFLDNVLTKFIDNPGKTFLQATFQRRSLYSAYMSRDLGLGAMGFHSLLQLKGIPFESGMAKSLNGNIFTHIAAKAFAATLKLAEERGEAPDMVGTGRRNAHLMAIAPNATSGIIAGTSPGIEPLPSNVYQHKTDSGTFLVFNKMLSKVLAKYDKDTPEVWKSIKESEGSVQHLTFLSRDERDVFKTAFEISQHWLIEHAAHRQPYIDQGQSLNLFFYPDVSKKTVHDVHMSAWKKGLKTLYYLRSDGIRRATRISKRIDRQLIEGRVDEPDGESCFGCAN